MSEQNQEPTTSTAADEGRAGAPLTDLMAADAKANAPVVDLEREALRAAEKALSAGQQALAQAATVLGTETAPARGARSGRELLLRALLIVNVVAMIVVALLPTSGGETAVDPAPHANRVGEAPAPGGPAPAPPPAAPRGIALDDPWNLALVAADRGEWATAIEILERHLADSPRMAPSQRLSVLMALGYYSSRIGNFTAAQEYQRKADAIEKSHSLPEDLLAMAKAAAASGDQESLRRVWARFLLQQRQIPSWLYKHVAEAYLQLGDSYRAEAEEAAERQRLRELEENAALLRAQREGAPGGK